MRIPKTIMQTGPHATDDGRGEPWRKANPGYEYTYFDDARCVEFLTEHFEEDVVEAFHTLLPGAFKADLFRYAYLYVKGGVYMDLDTAPVDGVTLEDIIKEDTDFVSVVEKRNIPGIYQAFIACVPGVPFLLDAVNRIVLHTQTEWYPPVKAFYPEPWIGILMITGPVLLATAARIRPTIGRHEHNGVSILFHQIYMGMEGPIRDANGKLLFLGTSRGFEPEKERYDMMVMEKRVYRKQAKDGGAIA